MTPVERAKRMLRFSAQECIDDPELDQKRKMMLAALDVVAAATIRHSVTGVVYCHICCGLDEHYADCPVLAFEAAVEGATT